MRISVIAFIYLTYTACETNRQQNHELIGEWKACWETKADESFSELKTENLRMDGIITFSPDGKVEITAFGYEGCIFSDDTLRNVLNWKLDDTVLRFIDQQDEYGLPYTIQKFTNNEMQLTLLEDINLILRRN